MTVIAIANAVDWTPKALFLTCIDSRLFPATFTQTDAGHMFVVRNIGNMVPHTSSVENTVGHEGAALELACLRNGIKDVVVCGHSDCKAMIALHAEPQSHLQERSPLTSWLNRHGRRSLEEFKTLKEANFSIPFKFEMCSKVYDVHLNRYDVPDTDKLSMINALVQTENVAKYSFMTELVTSGEVNVSTLWFAVNTGDVYIFDKDSQSFKVVDEEYKLNK